MHPKAEMGWGHPRAQPGPVQDWSRGYPSSRPYTLLPEAGSRICAPGRNVDANPHEERWGLEGREGLGPISSVTGAGTTAFHVPDRVALVSAMTWR